MIPVVYRISEDRAGATDLALVRFVRDTTVDEAWIGLELGEGVAIITLSRESAERLHCELAIALTYGHTHP